MTSFYDIGALLEKRFEKIGKYTYYSIYSVSPYKQLKERIEYLLAGNPGVVAAPGVPGAGKTTFYAFILANHLKDIICDEGSSHYLYVYIAPTNDLVRDFMEKFMKFLKGVFGVDCPPDKLSERIRVYGSKISAPRYTRLLKAVDDKVVLVASTDWQRVSARILSSKEQYYLIDEASRMTFVRLFIPIADAIARGRSEGEIRGFAVIGDENQAVGLSYEEREQLFLHAVRKIENSDYVDVIPLTISWRLPEYTARPIKYGFYNGNLTGRGNPLTIQATHEEVKKLLETEKRCKKYEKYIEMFLNVAMQHPLVHLELGEHFRSGEKYDEKRAELGWCMAYVLSQLVKNKRISVVVPYTKMAFAVRILGQLPNVVTATVASYLGREDDIIISIFGKEQASNCNTYYMQDPYTFNVQMSRQRNAIYTVGSAEILKMSSEYCTKLTQKKRQDRLKEGWDKLTRTLDMLLQMRSVVRPKF